MVLLYQDIESSYALRCLRISDTARYPNALAHVAMVNLRDNFSKTDALSKTELRKDLANLKLKEDTDTSGFFDGLIKVEMLSINMANDYIIESNYVPECSWLRQRSN